MSPVHLPTTIICAGGGGVGKTTTSAALALALARQGKVVLVVTVDRGFLICKTNDGRSRHASSARQHRRYDQ